MLQNSDQPLIVSSLLTHGSDALSQEELTLGDKLGVRIIALLVGLPLAPLIEKLDDFAHGIPLVYGSARACRLIAFPLRRLNLAKRDTRSARRAGMAASGCALFLVRTHPELRTLSNWGVLNRGLGDFAKVSTSPRLARAVAIASACLPSDRLAHHEPPQARAQSN